MKRTSIIVAFICLFFTLAMQAQNTLRMNSNQRLDKGQKIEVAGKGFLTMQTDGNLVAYTAANQPKWATGTNGRAVTHALMQTDGNLVIYNGTTPVWASNTWNIGANNGYFEIDLTTWRVAIFKAAGVVAKELQAGVAPPPPPSHTITVFCEAGYVSRFKFSYRDKGQDYSSTSPDLSLGFSHQFSVPATAENIKLNMYCLAPGSQTFGTFGGGGGGLTNIQEYLIVEKWINTPASMCFKTYGTVHNPQWNNDCPGGAPAPGSNQIKFTHGAGFVANWQITYNQPGKPATNINPLGTTLGWKNTYTIPADATNIRILIQGATGLIWEPWRTTYDKTFPTPPSSLCIKIFGTTLDQKWNSDCY
jgi:hypothetical protein